MRRLVALFLVAAAVGGAVFFADRPGRVEIVWQDWQVDTSVGVLVGAVALVVEIASLLVLLGAALHRMPLTIRRRRAARRRRGGERALTQGIVALAAGQAAEAERAAQRATALLDGAPMALLLAAEAATRQGDIAAARGHYTMLLDRPDSEFLGLRGLIGQALRAGDDVAARHFAERARRLRPDASWLIDALLLLAARAGDWAAAQATLAGAMRHRALPAERERHHRGIVLYELSRDAERRGDPRRAVRLAATAQVLAADLAAPACHHARLLIGLGKSRAAARTIERAWHTAPHPDLARLYLEIDPDATPLTRAAAVQRLAAQNPEASESHLAIAEAALDARLWGEARRHLALAIAAATTPRVHPPLGLRAGALPVDGPAGGEGIRQYGGVARLARPCDRCAARPLLSVPPVRRRRDPGMAGAVPGVRRVRHARLAEPAIRRQSRHPAPGERRRALDAAGAAGARRGR